MEIARYEKRIIAYLIDLVSATIPAFALFLFLYIFTKDKVDIPGYFFALAAQLLTFIFFVLFTFLFLIISKGYTLGSLIIGIKVIHITKRAPSIKESFLRAITIGVIPMVIINVIYMLAVHTEKTIFDRISETIVVDSRLSRRLEGHFRVKK